jgi:Zn finger protein HypA/HybF involved in hydrogenase expression
MIDRDKIKVRCVDCGKEFETHVLADNELCPECRGA